MFISVVLWSIKHVPKITIRNTPFANKKRVTDLHIYGISDGIAGAATDNLHNKI